MAGLVLVTDDGRQIPIKDIESMNENANILFFMVNVMMRKDYCEELEKELTEKTGVKSIVLEGMYGKVLGV